jgi:hypothetical protein
MTSTRAEADKLVHSLGYDKNGFTTCDPATLINLIDAALVQREAAVRAETWNDAIQVAENALCCGRHGYCGHGPTDMADEIVSRLKQVRDTPVRRDPAAEGEGR